MASPPVVVTPPAPPPAPSEPPATPVGPTGLLPVLTATVSGRELSVAVTGTALANIGGVARTDGDVDGIRRFVLLLRAKSDQVVALNGICTHEGCIVTNFTQPSFECPCHGSQYNGTGGVVRGPAPASLPQLTTEFDGQIVRIRI